MKRSSTPSLTPSEEARFKTAVERLCLALAQSPILSRYRSMAESMGKSHLSPKDLDLITRDEEGES